MNSKAVLVACAIALGACSSDHDPDEPAAAVPSAWKVQTPRLEPMRVDSEPPRAELVKGHADSVAMAATDHGLVAFDPDHGEVVASADTLYQVVDVVHDPWRDRWIAAEYDDDSQTRVSVWELVHRGRFGGKLQLDRTIETGGYCRVAAGASSIVIFEHDGMHQRWMVWEAQGRARASSLQVPLPAGFVVRTDAPASRLVSLSSSDDGSGPRTTMHAVRVRGGLAGPVLESRLPGWSGTLDPLRAADAGPGRIAIAQVRDATLRLGLVDDHGQVLRDTIQVKLRGANAAEDLVVDDARAIAIVAVSSPDRLLTVDLEHGALLDQQDGAALPSGGTAWFSRWMAYDATRGRLMVGGSEELAAWDLSGTGGLDRVVGFGVAGARWPVALSASRSGPRP